MRPAWAGLPGSLRLAPSGPRSTEPSPGGAPAAHGPARLVSPLTRKRPRGRGCHQGPGCLPPLSSGPPLGGVWKENTETWKMGSREMSVIPALPLLSHSHPWLSALPYGFSWARQSSSRPLPLLPVPPRGAEGSGQRRHRGGLPRVRAFTGAVGTSRVLEALTTISSNLTVFHRRWGRGKSYFTAQVTKPQSNGVISSVTRELKAPRPDPGRATRDPVRFQN